MVGGVVAVLVAVVLAISWGGDDGEPSGAVTQLTIVSSTGDGPPIEEVSISLDGDLPGQAEIRIDADDADRIDITGNALCAPAAGAEGAWLAIDICDRAADLTITATDGNEETITATVALP